nr:MAG TPA: hypothetical protein [Caudoviricetes sp.]
MDTVYFTYDDNHGRKLDTRDITRIANRTGGEHRVMVKTSQHYRSCVWNLQNAIFLLQE